MDTLPPLHDHADELVHNAAVKVMSFGSPCCHDLIEQFIRQRLWGGANSAVEGSAPRRGHLKELWLSFRHFVVVDE